MSVVSKRRRTADDKRAMEQEALSRAVGNLSASNWPAIFSGFMAKGIPESEILPRENVFTYHAWRALGRQVRRGEHGVKVTTWITASGKEDTEGENAPEPENASEKKGKSGFRFCRFATVFHVSQTDPIATSGSEVRQ